MGYGGDVGDSGICGIAVALVARLEARCWSVVGCAGLGTGLHGDNWRFLCKVYALYAAYLSLLDLDGCNSSGGRCAPGANETGAGIHKKNSGGSILSCYLAGVRRHDVSGAGSAECVQPTQYAYSGIAVDIQSYRAWQRVDI